MKKGISALAIATALAASSASAADLPSRKEAPVFVPPPVFSWTGPYVGLNLGGGWLDRTNNWNSNPLLFGPFFPNVGLLGLGSNNNGSNGGVVGGFQIGYNYQLSPLFVVGVETDFQGTSIGSSSNNNWWGGWGNRVSLPWFGTLRGRVGLALLDSRLLVYGTGGFAYGEARQPWGGGWWGNNNDIATGWTAGGGIEYAFLPNWSAKVEYLYTDLSNNNNNNNWSAVGFPFGGFNGFGGGWWWNNRHARLHTVRAGVNYHFNLFTPAPVVARY